MDTIGTKAIVLVSEVPLFQGKNNIMHLHKVGTRSSVLINEVSLFQGCPLREVPLYIFHTARTWFGQAPMLMRFLQHWANSQF